MRVLLVNHTFLPESYAGSELCVLGQAKAMQEQGHEAAVFYRTHDPAMDEYAIRQGRVESIPTYAINNTYRFVRSFQDIYVNFAIGARFAYLLREYKPDIVHFHHLTNLSFTLAREVKEYGCPSVMTLHDYWLLCQRGQLLKRDLSLCHGPSHEECRSCLAPQLLKGKWHRFFRFVQNRCRKIASGEPADEVHLLDNKPLKVDSTQRHFVKNTHFDMGDGEQETLQAHPPSAITYQLKQNEAAVLECSIGLHPSTYDQPGGGVCFQIERNGETIFSRLLNPKKNSEHQGWHEVRVELPAVETGENMLVLKTLPEPGKPHDYCTAGWLKPTVRYVEKAPKGRAVFSDFSERRAMIQSLVSQAADQVFAAVTAFSSQATEGIEHRKQSLNRVWNEIDYFLSPSRFLLDFFVKHGLQRSKIEFLDNGFAPVEKSPRPSLQYPLRFGYIGTWIPSKGVDLALKAFQKIDPRKGLLYIHGFFPGYDGYEHYEDYLHSLDSPAVRWGSKYEPGQVMDFLKDIDCLIMPSLWWENSPLTIHEAFQAGVPVLTADVGGMAEQVRQGGGLTFHHRDADHLYQVISTLLRKPDVLERLRRTIPDVQSIQDHVDRLLEIYERLMETEKN